MRNALYLVIATFAFSLPVTSQGALLLETHLQLPDEGRGPVGVLYLRVADAEVHYSFWARPLFEGPRAFWIEAADETHAISLGEGRQVRFDYDAWGFNPIPLNPFLTRPPSNGGFEEVDFLDIEFPRFTSPALTMWTEFSGSVEDLELARLLRTDQGLIAIMEVIYGRDPDREFYIPDTEGRGQLTMIPEPSVVGLFIGSFALLVVGGLRRLCKV